jgi:hypothetical protein
VDGPVCLLLLPAPLEDFILRETARDLLRAPRVVALEPPHVPYGVFGRMPEPLSHAFAAAQARRLRKIGDVKVVVVFHPLQAYLAEALLNRWKDAELWYSRWDRYELAHNASPKLRRRLAELHDSVASRSSYTWAVSEPLVTLEEEAGRGAALVVPPHDTFPAPDPAPVVAVTLGHLGYRTDWKLLRELGERMGGDLVLLLVGERYDDEGKGDPDFEACTELPNLVWLGRLGDEAAARIIATADVGIVPFADEPFNDAALPQRIIKYARLGRRTLAPDLAGMRTLPDVVTTCATIDDWERELRAARGRRLAPDAELRAWALAQTAERQNDALWLRLEAAGVAEFSE